MDFTTTSIKPRLRRAVSGFTLVEYMIATGVGAIVAIAVIGFVIYTSRGFAGMMNYVDLENQSRLTLDTMSREIRQTTALTGYTSNQLTFSDYDTKALDYTYSPTDRTLTRTKGGVSKVLLADCEALSFAIYQRNTTNGTYDQYPTSLQASNCKVVQLNWVCSRKITGARMNSDSVQTAKIVIRNQSQ